MSRQGGDMRSSVGVDVGGTFTDLVAGGGAGRLRACKVPTTPANLARGVLNGLLAVRPATGAPASVAHGTTVVTNAIVERRGARGGLVATPGFRDVLEIARQSRPPPHHPPPPPKPPPPVGRRGRPRVTERPGARGRSRWRRPARPRAWRPPRTWRGAWASPAPSRSIWVERRPTSA